MTPECFGTGPDPERTICHECVVAEDCELAMMQTDLELEEWDDC